MPYVNIKITREQNTPEQKAALIRGVTQLLVGVLGKNPQTSREVWEIGQRREEETGRKPA